MCEIEHTMLHFTAMLMSTDPGVENCAWNTGSV